MIDINGVGVRRVQFWLPVNALLSRHMDQFVQNVDGPLRTLGGNQGKQCAAPFCCFCWV